MPPWAVALALGPMLAAGRAVDESKPYGRVCVSVVDPRQGQEAVVGGGLAPKAGRLLTVHLDSNTDGEALVVAFSKKSGVLAHGWRPALAPLKAWEERTLPARAEPWAWPGTVETLEVFVVFLARDSAAAGPIRELVARLRDPAAEAAAQKAQARQLRDELRKWQGDDRALATAPESAPTAIAGTVRTVGEFPWRERARKANFSAAQPAVLVFRNAAAP